MRRLLAIAILLCSTLLAAASVTVATADIGHFTFALHDDGTASLLRLSTEGSKAALTSFELPNEANYGGKTYYVTEIADYAFAGNTKVTTVNMGSNVRRIGTRAFKSCSALYTVRLRATNSELCEYAFEDCRNLKHVYYPWIGDAAPTGVGSGPIFTGLPATARLHSIATGTNLEAMRRSAKFGTAVFGGGVIADATDASNGETSIVFTRAPMGNNGEAVIVRLIDKKTAITKATKAMPEWHNAGYESRFGYYRITRIAPRAFAGNTQLTAAQLTQLTYLEEIGSNAFDGCTSLTTVNTTAREIGLEAFARCTSLTSLTLDEGVYRLHDYCISGCTNLTNLHLPKSLAIISKTALARCSIATFTVASGNTHFTADTTGALMDKTKTILLRYPPQGPRAATPAATITDIGDFAFEGAQVDYVHLPYGVTTLGEGAFDRCTAQEILVPSSTSVIGHGAFRDCANLKNLLINRASAPFISSTTFAGLPPDCMLRVATAGLNNEPDAYADNFVNSTYWHEAFDRQHITAGAIDFVAGGVSYTVYSGTNVRVARNKVQFGEEGQYNTESLSGAVNVTNPVVNGIRFTCDEVGVDAFAGNTKITSVALPDATHYIGNNAFNGCTSLANVVWKGMAYVYDFAFNDCSELRSELPASLKRAGDYAFYNCRRIRADFEKTKVEEIRESAFENCAAITLARLPYGFKSLGNNAFKGSGITEIRLPSSTTSVATNATEGCKNLNKFYVNLRTIPSNWDETFTCGNADEVVLFVPFSAVDTYRANQHLNKMFTARRILAGAFDHTEKGGFYTVTRAAGTNTNGKARLVYNNDFSPSAISATSFAIPPTITIGDTYYVVDEIETKAMTNRTHLESLYCSDSMRFIGAASFQNLASLRTVNFGTIGGSRLERVDSVAFAECNIGADVILPNKCAIIGVGAFSNNNIERLLVMSTNKPVIGTGFLDGNDGAQWFVRQQWLGLVTTRPDAENRLGAAVDAATAITTLASPVPLDVTKSRRVMTDGTTAETQVQAFAAIGYDATTKTVTTQELTAIPSKEGVLLKTSPATTVIVPPHGSSLPRLNQNLLTAVMSTNGANVSVTPGSKNDTYLWQGADNAFTLTTEPFTMRNEAYLLMQRAITAGEPQLKLDVAAIFGDVNNDGKVNVSDINILVSASLAGDYDPAYDLNNDGTVNVSDINLGVSAALAQ